MYQGKLTPDELANKNFQRYLNEQPDPMPDQPGLSQCLRCNEEFFSRDILTDRLCSYCKHETSHVVNWTDIYPQETFPIKIHGVWRQISSLG